MSYLIDTDWLIDYLNGRSNGIQMIESLIPHQLAISVVTYVEIYDGVYSNRDADLREAAFLQFLNAASVLDVGADIARICARLRGDLRRVGTPVSMADLLIASTAPHHDLTLVTRNLRHFERVPGLKLLSSPRTTG